MVPLQQDLAWRCNAPAAEQWTLTDVDPDTGVTVAQDLSGCSLRMQARSYPNAAGAPLIDLAMAAEGAPGFYISDAPNGVYVLTPPTIATLQALIAAYPPIDATIASIGLSYDILLIGTDGIPESLFVGTLTLIGGDTLL